MPQEDYSAPASISVSSVEELRKKLSEGLSDIEASRVIPAAVVNQRLREKVWDMTTPLENERSLFL